MNELLPSMKNDEKTYFSYILNERTKTHKRLISIELFRTIKYKM